MTPDQDPYVAALAHARANRLAAAMAAADEAIAADRGHGAALALKASLQLELGEAGAAIETCDGALDRDPGNARAHSVRADALARLGRKEEALVSYESALAVEPANLPALVNRAVLLMDLQRYEASLASCDAALKVSPSLAAVHSNRANVLVQLHRPEEALASADMALALQPEHANAWINRGDALRALKRFEPAAESFRIALRHEPTAFRAMIGLGSALRGLGRYDEAIAAYDAADKLGTGTSSAAYQRSLVKLLTGDFEAGWRESVARWKSPEFLASASGFVTPAMRAALRLGPKPAELAGRRILLVSEQGIGDQLMFLSMLSDLVAVAASVACVCDRRLIGLLANSFPQVPFFDSRDGVPGEVGDFDLAVASGDLGGAFRNRVADFPGEPYVRPRAAVVEAWAGRLGPRTRKLRVGLSWRGGVKATNMEGRSIALAQLVRLLKLKDCEFVSLQYGAVADEVEAMRSRFGVDLRQFPKAEIDDFEQLAGLIEGLDVVVSVQTAIVHLCGALGKTCLTLVPVRPEWRYTVSSETIPWYRSVRIFRQDGSEAWAPVIDKVVKALAARAAQAP